MFCINFELCNWLLSWLLRSILLRWLGELKMMRVVGVVACEEERWLLAVWSVPMWVPRSARKDQYAPKYSAFKVLWKMDKRDLLVNFGFGQSWLSMPQGWESSERDLSDSADSVSSGATGQQLPPSWTPPRSSGAVLGALLGLFQ